MSTESINNLADQISGLSFNRPNVSTAPIARAPSIQEIVRETVDRALREQAINNNNNIAPENDNNYDQEINICAHNDLTGLDKIPDIVKSLREFSGNPNEFSSWKKSVDRILKIYETIRGTPKYYGILSVIRNKIVGQADTALESYNTPLNWIKISRCLIMHFADKRDIGTLEYQLTTLIQNNNSISEFYQLVYQHLSLILNKLACLEMSEESLAIMTQTYRQIALDTFIRGLKGDLSRLLSIREPQDLPQALHLCLKIDNMNYRTQHALNSQANFKKFTTSQSGPSYRTMPSQFFPELAHFPQIAKQQNNIPQRYQPPIPPRYNNYHNGQHNAQARPWQNAQFRPLPPKPLPRADPMDVDRSIHSKIVNYQNRPNYNSARNLPQNPAYKRYNDSNRAYPANKIQRTYYTETQNHEEDCEVTDNYENQCDNQPTEDIETFDEIETLDEPIQINFLM